MSVGGKVVQVYEESDRIWVNTVDDSGEYCAIFVENFEGDWKLELGDKLWWQQGKAHWTKGEVTRELAKIGCSGVNHPLGKEYQLVYNWETIAKQRREKLIALKEVVEEWLSATPQPKSGTFDPVNQPQAYKAQAILERWHKW
jgi:hypothetical protein